MPSGIPIPGFYGFFQYGAMGGGGPVNLGWLFPREIRKRFSTLRTCFRAGKRVSKVALFSRVRIEPFFGPSAVFVVTERILSIEPESEPSAEIWR